MVGDGLEKEVWILGLVVVWKVGWSKGLERSDGWGAPTEPERQRQPGARMLGGFLPSSGGTGAERKGAGGSPSFLDRSAELKFMMSFSFLIAVCWVIIGDVRFPYWALLGGVL